MIVLSDTGFHAAEGDPTNLKLCQRGEWEDRMLVETVLSMLRWCPSIACIKEQRSDVDRSLVELGVKVAWHAVAQQDFHGPRRVRHPCRYS